MSKGNIAHELQYGWNILTGSDTWNPGAIADGDEEAKEITVSGATLGDFVLAVSFSKDVEDLQLTADVTDDDTVTAVLSNSTGSSVNLDEGTIYVIVMKNKLS